MRKHSRPLPPFVSRQACAAAAFAVTAAPLLPSNVQAQTAPAGAAAEYVQFGASAAPAFQDQPGGSALARIVQAQGGTLAPLAAPSLAGNAPTSLTRLANYAPGQAPRGPAAARARAAVGRSPDVFGAVALPVSHTAMDSRWAHVAHAAAPTDARWRRMAATAAALPEHRRLSLVNTWINDAITFESDLQNYGVSDYWASARESLARGRGDCEDYAIAKLQLLRAAGVPADALYLVVARDLVRRADHALLLVRLDDGFWVLDSATDDVLPAEAVADYRPIVTFSAGREWMHGYRRLPRLELASAAPPSPAVGR
jgi:predicted transglutaminase-like cysteine proteinase